jgi:hypothetical protein
LANLQLWNLAKYYNFFHYDLRYWLDFWYARFIQGNNIASTNLDMIRNLQHLHMNKKSYTYKTWSVTHQPLGQLEPNLAGMFLGWFSTKFLFFVPVGYSTWLPGPIICSDRLKFQRPSSLKLMNWLNPNCKWMFLEDLQMIIPGQIGFICPSGFREEAFLKYFSHRVQC